MPKLTLAEVKRRARRVKVVLMDIDGVLANGLIYHMVDASGKRAPLRLAVPFNPNSSPGCPGSGPWLRLSIPSQSRLLTR
jgi:hypothetical protein